jgi:hypothetical protein
MTGNVVVLKLVGHSLGNPSIFGMRLVVPFLERGPVYFKEVSGRWVT